MSLTSPLGLMRHVRRPDLRFEVVPWLNVLVAAWLLTLLQTNYIIAPGLTVPLGVEDAATKTTPAFTLPTSPTPSAGTPGQPPPAPGRLVDAQLSVQSSPGAIEDKIFYLKNGSYHYDKLQGALTALAKDLKKQPGDQPVLLLLAPKDMDIETFEKICHMAQTAGFGDVQLAEKTPATTDQPGAAPNPASPTTP